MTKEKHVLNAKSREKLGSTESKRARRQGMVPAVVYGHGEEPKHFLLDAKEWTIISKQDINIIQLKQDNGDVLNVLIKDIQYDYLHGITTHIDFLEVNMNETVIATVPIHTHGTPAGLTQGGMLEILMHEINVSCTPNNMPEAIELEISELEVNESIKIKDIKFPEGVSGDGDLDITVLHILPGKVSDSEEEEEESTEG